MFNVQYLLSNYYVLDTLQGFEGRIINKTEAILALRKLVLSWEILHYIKIIFYYFILCAVLDT